MDLQDDLDTSDELANAFMKSFEEYDDDSIIIHENEPKSKVTNPVAELINTVLLDRAKFNKSYAAASAHSVTINSVPGAQISIPTEKNKMKREATLQFQYETYIFCDTCKLLYKKGELCEKCGRSSKKRKNNYFIYIPILQQIMHTLDKYLDLIIHTIGQERKEHELSDVFDSNVYKEASLKCGEQILLPLSVNLDGAKIFNSSKSTLWPIQIIQHYLPASIRFRRENLLIVGLYCGPEKPNVSHIMAPFANEMRLLRQKGIFTMHENELLHFSPAVLFCVCDLPARAEVQNVKPSGYFGCACCVIKGEAVKNPKTHRSYVRFLKVQQPEILRTHTDAITVGYDALRGGAIMNPKGLKGLSCMVAFKDFNLVDSFALDWMHGVCIGILPLLLDIWLGKKKPIYDEDESYHFKPFTAAQRLELNRRIASLKPPTRISHKPRSILDRSFYTANEYRSLLWFYLRFSLYGILKKDLLSHFILLSEATYMLSKTHISQDEISKAEKMLIKFADDFEYYYGRNAVTINVHNLRHYANSVRKTGPLWCNSAFPFESNMGELKKSFNCTTDVVEQIAWNLSIRAAKPTEANPPPLPPKILRIKHQILTLDQQKLLSHCGFPVTGRKNNIGYEIAFKKQVFKSSLSLVTKSIDNFVQLADNSMGSIEFFIQLSKPYAKIYEVIKTCGHLKQVQSSGTNMHKLFDCDEIIEKLIYLKFTFSNVSFIEIITSEPNPFECN